MKDQLITTILILAGLTREELSKLGEMLSRNGDAFYRQAEAIGQTALYLEETGKIRCGDDAWNGLWNHRQPVVDTMDEIYELMHETHAAAARLREADQRLAHALTISA